MKNRSGYSLMKIIKASCGTEIKVSEEWHEILCLLKWYIHEPVCGSGRKYAITRRMIKGKVYTCYMHRIIADPANGMVVDHQNGDSLDNRIGNLRVCTKTENNRNRIGLNKDTSSVFKGVHHHRGKFWTAGIYHQSRRMHLGCFKTEHEAARAYNEAALKYHGEFARLNIIED